MIVPDNQFDVSEDKTKKTSRRGGSKTNQVGAGMITVLPKYYKSLSAAANKFVPVQDAATPEESEESEEESPKVKAKQSKKQPK